MYGIQNYAAFIVAGILLNITPGSDTIYILTRSIGQGKKAGVYSVLGISTGGLVHTFFAAFGLSVILSTSAELFAFVKYIGAAYLIYLGLKMIIDKSELFRREMAQHQKMSMKKIYKQGILTNVLNPKVALFFLSFIPQFIEPGHANGPLPFIILGLTFMTTGTMWCLFLSWAASYMTKMLRNNRKIGIILQKVSGSIFILLGLHLVFEKVKPIR
jgi:RhtB (resistance to homoserine/threonine) family protein